MNQTLRRVLLALSVFAVLSLAAPGGTLAQPPPAGPAPSPAATKKELEKRIKDAEKRAKKLEQEARDDDRRANSWRRRAEDAERIARTEQAEQNRRIADGFAKDAQRRREEAQKARTEATDARLKLANLKAGRPISPSAPTDPGAPAPPRPVPLEPDVPGLSEPPSPPQAVPQTGGPAPGAQPRPDATPNPFVTPTGPAAPGAPAQPVRPRAHCPIRNGTETNVRTFVRADPDNHDHTFCGQFQNALKRILFTGARDQFFVVAFEDVPTVLNCTAATPGSCDGRCEGRIPRLAGQENVAIEIRGLDFEWRTGKFVGDLVFYFPGGEFVVGFEGQAELPQSATPYPLVAAGGLALIVLGLVIRRPRRPGVESL